MAAGFPAGREDGHHLINHTADVAIYLEVGKRSGRDEVHYPDIDLHLSPAESAGQAVSATSRESLGNRALDLGATRLGKPGATPAGVRQ